MISRQTETSIQPTVQELAEEFLDLGADEQAEFFNACARIVNSRWKAPWSFQACAIDKTDKLTFEGRSIIEKLYDKG